MSTIASKVKDAIVEVLGVAPSEVMEATTFESLNADSIDVMTIIMQLEFALLVTIEDRMADELQTVGELVAHVERLTCPEPAM